MKKIAIGCAGWSIPREHRDLFGDGDSALARYATRFPVVEINSSFYRSHRRTTYARWAATVPSYFRFSVKMPRTISHEKALRGAGPELDQFLEEISGLGGTLGGLLLQLPPSQPLDMRVASTFFRMLRRRSDAPVACEPRHLSWFSTDADALLERHAVARVIADPPVQQGLRSEPRNPWPYWRLHGAPRMYYSEYTDARLRTLAESVGRVANAKPWVIFDNTAAGFAVANAARLQSLLDASPSRREAARA